MFDTHEFMIHARLDVEVLETWIDAGWLVPRRDDAARRFSEIDLARAHLIRDLQEDMGVNDEGVAVILDLVDQVHGLRRTLRELVSALGAQPEPLRHQIVADMRRATLTAGSGTDGARSELSDRRSE
jgi:chaperone modulatory protein CbpM